MGIEVSIIMNSYNKYPQNLLSLYALENQTFDLSKMEVILVDDASTDSTRLLENYAPPYVFKYIRCEENTGRSKAKNIGIHASQGNILIILDAEMIVDPEFVEQHYQYHQSEDKLLITGCTNHHSVYTVLDGDLGKGELTKFAQLARRNLGQLPKKTRDILKGTILRSLNGFGKQEKNVVFSKNDIKNLKYKLLSVASPVSLHIINMFGHTFKGFYAPWIFVITRNISLRRSLFDAVGPFYEELKGWGFEDWEFGYRVYEYGGKILDDQRTAVYHQEHPKMTSDIFKDEKHNYLKFYTRHPSFEVGIFSLRYIDYYMYRFDFIHANELVQEFNILEQAYEEQSKNFRFCCLQFLKKILELSVAEKPVTQLIHVAEISDEQLELIMLERDFIKSLEKCRKLMNVFDFLLNK